MTHPILVPVDGSPVAEYAIPWALALSRGAPLHLVHVHVPPTPVAVEGIVVADPTLDRSLRDQEAEYLAGLTARVRAAAPQVAVESRCVDTDDPLGDAIAHEAAASGAAYVVMCTHGRGAFGRFWLGSVTDDTVRASPAPVLVIHPGKEPADFAAVPPVAHVLIPLDGSALAEQVVDRAVEFARVFLANVTLLLVQEPGSAPDGRSVDDVSSRLADAGVPVSTVVRQGAPAKAIVEFATSHPGTAVALATHGRTGFGWLLNGSVADEVVHHATGPVLVYHPQTA